MVLFRLPLSIIKKELLTELNVAPAQLHPNSWAFIRAFIILCSQLGISPTVKLFLYFFEAKHSGHQLWESLSGAPGRGLPTLFQSSYKNFKGQFPKIRASTDSDAHTTLGLIFKRKRNATTPSIEYSHSDEREPHQEVITIQECEAESSRGERLWDPDFDVSSHGKAFFLPSEEKARLMAHDEDHLRHDTFVEPSGVQALKNPNPLKDVEALVVLGVAVLV